MLEKRIKFKHGSLDLFFRISYSQLFFFFFLKRHMKSRLKTQNLATIELDKNLGCVIFFY
jgi:hypothetical protein